MCSIDGLVATPIVQMSQPVNVFLAAFFAKALELPKTTIGVLTAIPFACNFLQIFISPFIARWRSPQVISVIGAAGATVSWAALGLLLPFLPRHNPTATGHWLELWFFVTSMCGALAGVAWNAWIQEWVPGRVRGKYFGRRNGWLQFSVLIFLLGAGWTLARWDYAMPAFQAIIGAAVLLRLYSLYLIWASPTPRPPRHHVTKLPLREQLAVLRADPALLLFIAFGSVWFFAANAFGPFYIVFLFEQLHFSALDLGLFSTLSALGGGLSMPAWGRLLDRYGNKAVMAFSLILWQGQNFLWCFLTPDNRNLSYAMWLWGGTTSAGFMLGQFTLLLKVIPVEAKNLAIGVNLAITSLVAAIAPVLGGMALSWALQHWPGHTLAVYHVCFLVQPVLAILGITLLLRLREPQASNFTSLVGAMRSIRTLSGIFGLSFLTDYIFYRAPTKK
ncbi:MAG: MFS transporter [Opitutae bacterium]|nr:MFS transporter [Opitutae bacterium]